MYQSRWPDQKINTIRTMEFHFIVKAYNNIMLKSWQRLYFPDLVPKRVKAGQYSASFSFPLTFWG